MDFSPHNACGAKLQAKAELLVHRRMKFAKTTPISWIGLIKHGGASKRHNIL
jgi:hypothetical protein